MDNRITFGTLLYPCTEKVPTTNKRINCQLSGCRSMTQSIFYHWRQAAWSIIDES